MKNRIVLLALIVALLLPTAALFAQGEKAAPAADQVYNVKMPTAEVEGDPMTVWAHEFAAYMKEATDGKFNITVYPYGSLGENDDIVEQAQLGINEFTFADYGWISAFVDLANVLALHYIWPYERLPEVLHWVVKNGDSYEIIKDAFIKQGLYPLGILFEGWQWMTSKKPVTEISHLRGLKTRVMGSAMLTMDYRAYDIVPTPLAYGEIYSALATGLLDAQSQPMFANSSMGFFEVAQHFVQLWAEPFLGLPTVNYDFWMSLPQEYRDLIENWWHDKIVSSEAWVNENNEGHRARIIRERPNTTFYEMNDAQIAQLRKLAEEKVWPNWGSIGGPGSDELLKTLLNDVENAKKALGI